MKTLRKLWWRLTRRWRPRKVFYRCDDGIFRRVPLETLQSGDCGIVHHEYRGTLILLFAFRVVSNDGIADNGRPAVTVEGVDLGFKCLQFFADQMFCDALAP